MGEVLARAPANAMRLRDDSEPSAGHEKRPARGGTLSKRRGRVVLPESTILSEHAVELADRVTVSSSRARRRSPTATSSRSFGGVQRVKPDRWPG